MKILKRAKTDFRFRVVRPFIKGGRGLEAGEECELSEPDQTECVANGRAVPLDLPPVGVYITLKPFFVPGNIEKFEAKAMELVSLKAEDALRLMLQGVVIPKDESRWRPNNRRLARLSPLGGKGVKK